MRLKHHILLYTFLGVAVLISIFLTLDYGNRAQRSAQALEDAARLHGITFWDTDNAYGSQTQVACALRRFPREEIAITSKTYGRSREEAEYDLTRTLRELETPCLDFFLLHEVAGGTLSEKMPAFAYMLEMQKKGLVRAVGLSTHCAPVISAAAVTETKNVSLYVKCQEL